MLSNLTFALVALILALATAARAEPLTLVALGDSLTAGYGLPPEQGYVPQLQAWLQARGAEVTVENAGVSGDTTAGGLSRLDWSLTPETDALIVNLGGNDMLRGVDPAEARQNLDAILAGAQARQLPVLLVGLQAPGNFGPDYKQAFDAIFPDLSAQYGALLYPDYFAPLRGSGDDAQALQDYMQPDAIHPNAEGVSRIVEAIGPSVLDLLQKAAP